MSSLALYSLTRQQTKTVEDVQRRAVQIIAGNIPYADGCESMGLSSLADSVVNFLYVSLTMNSTLFIIYYLLSVTLS